MKLVFVSLLLSAGLAAADTHSFREVPARAGAGPQQPTLYSFADVYRLTVSGPMRAPDKWMLALAGLALAGWVAHRRLSNSL